MDAIVVIAASSGGLGPLLTSAAMTCGSRVIGIVLSGGDSDGAGGLRAIKDRGGMTVVQHPR
jgi:two-component system, chemotaxis family, protein-glutamate methylesterase/glutaminase